MEFGVAHDEAASVVVFGAAGNVVVECAAGGDYDVDEFAFNKFTDDASGACGDYVSGE